MPYFYCETLDHSCSDIELSREESQHLCKTLRIKTGNTVHIINGRGLVASTIVTNTPKGKGKVKCKIIYIEELPKPKKRVHLYLAPPRHNILSGLIKQCVELGVWEIHFIECEFSVAKPKDKADSLMKDIIAGAKQSRNPHFPKIHKLEKFESAIRDCTLPVVVGAVPEDQFEELNKKIQDVSLWIGPEGGFSKTEKNLLSEKKGEALCIGKNILRVETATVGLLSILLSS